MSCMERKTILRAKIPFLKDFSRNLVYEYFENILGKANEVEIWDDEIEYFRYDTEIQPVEDNEGNWGVDYVFHHSSDYTTYIDNKSNGITLTEFQNKAFELANLFGIEPNSIKLMSYDWYNGGDEPISF